MVVVAAEATVAVNGIPEGEGQTYTCSVMPREVSSMR